MVEVELKQELLQVQELGQELGQELLQVQEIGQELLQVVELG